MSALIAFCFGALAGFAFMVLMYVLVRWITPRDPSVVSRATWKRMQEEIKNPPKANQALKDFVAKHRKPK